MALPRVAGAYSGSPTQFAAAYSTPVTTIGTNATTTFSVGIQAAYNFLWRRLNAQFNRSDWSFNIQLSGLGRNLFDVPLRGALIFGEAASASSPIFAHGWTLAPPQEVPANSNLIVTVTNGATGSLDITFGFIGTNYR